MYLFIYYVGSFYLKHISSFKAIYLLLYCIHYFLLDMVASQTHLISDCGYLDHHLVLVDVMGDHIAALLPPVVGEKDALSWLQLDAGDGSEAGSDKIGFAKLLRHGIATQCLRRTMVHTGRGGGGSASCLHNDRFRRRPGRGPRPRRGRGRDSVRRRQRLGLGLGLEIESYYIPSVRIHQRVPGREECGRRHRVWRRCQCTPRQARGCLHVLYDARVPESVRPGRAHLGADN